MPGKKITKPDNSASGMSAPVKKGIEQDSPWKTVMGRYFAFFMAFFFPHIYKDVDWDKGYDQLDTELTKIKRGSKTGKRLADKLVKVQLLNGQEKWLLIHVEVQGYRDKRFAERMFDYYVMIRHYYKRRVVSLAIFTDPAAAYRPGVYETNEYGCHNLFEYPTIKLLDYVSKRTQLENDSNPFALVVLAHLKAQEQRQIMAKNRRSKKPGVAGAKDPMMELLDWKIHLVQLLSQRDYPDEMAGDIFNFMDEVMELPGELEPIFEERLIREVEVAKMPYISSIERVVEKRSLARGLEQGLEQGQRQATLELVLLLLPKKTNQPLTQGLEKQIGKLSLAQLKSLAAALLDFSSQSDLTSWLETHQAEQS